MKKRGASFYIFILLALLALAALVFFLAPGRQPSTPAVTLPSAPAQDYSAPTVPESAAGPEMIAISTETVQTVIGTLRRIGSYTRTLEVRDFWSDGSRSRSISVWSKGDRLRLRIRTEGSDVAEELLFDGGEKWIWYSDSPAVYRGGVLSGETDEWQTLLTYEDLLSAPAEDILDAGYTVFSELSCIYVRWRFGALGYVSECYIDPATGLLMGERCYDGDKLIYSMDSSAPDVTTPDEQIFSLPQGAQ